MTKHGKKYTDAARRYDRERLYAPPRRSTS